LIPTVFLFFTFIWIPVGDSYQQVPIVYVDANGSYNGGYDPNDKVIYLNPDNLWLVDKYGLNVWTHEVLHAWDYSHADMLHLNTYKLGH
jgi:Zn-dependent membrane protease YugP